MGEVVISTNFVPANYNIDALFISNEKRLESLNLSVPKQVLATSNLKEYLGNALFFDYSSLLGEGDGSDNAGAMFHIIVG